MNIFKWLVAIERSRRQQRVLRDLPDHILKDVGLTRTRPRYDADLSHFVNGPL